MSTTTIIERVARATRTCTSSMSLKLGSDCVLHARFAQFLLQQNGIASRLCVGEAAWRVGPGDGDTIVHSYRLGGSGPQGEMAFPLHAWLEVENKIFDCTTHSMRIKARLLDQCDGGKTTVEWAPAYLFMDPSETLTLEEVTAALQPGVAFYRVVPALQARVQQVIDRNPLDEEDLLVLRMVYSNPHAVLVGPNDVVAACQS